MKNPSSSYHSLSKSEIHSRTKHILSVKVESLALTFHIIWSFLRKELFGMYLSLLLTCKVGTDLLKPLEK